jgi:aspartyl-tRNA(Asn)/glutamyl-tRNA(Gln) amidotransferase subunit C
MSDEKSENSGAMDVKYVAHLARMYLDPEQVEEFGSQLGEVLRYVEKLQELDLTGIEPTAHAIPVENVLRPDEVRPCLDHDAALENAPSSFNGEFEVPAILE